MKHLGDIAQIHRSGKDAVSEKKIILDLCGGSGSWSRPYVAGGPIDPKLADFCSMKFYPYIHHDKATVS